MTVADMADAEGMGNGLVPPSLRCGATSGFCSDPFWCCPVLQARLNPFPAGRLVSLFSILHPRSSILVFIPVPPLPGHPARASHIHPDAPPPFAHVSHDGNSTIGSNFCQALSGKIGSDGVMEWLGERAWLTPKAELRAALHGASRASAA
jgi:hypothetical protein